MEEKKVDTSTCLILLWEAIFRDLCVMILNVDAAFHSDVQAGATASVIRDK
jgi:hypothetical protein